MNNQDRGVEVRDLITHLQTLDPTARMVFTTDGYTDTPVCTSDFVRQASGAVAVILPKTLVDELESMSSGEQQEMDDLEDENYQLERDIKDLQLKYDELASTLATIHRTASEALED